MEGIKGRVVFVTGGENGLGERISHKFAEAGAKVVVYGIDEAKGNEVAKKLNEISEGSIYIKGDVRSHDDLKKAMDIIMEKFGKLDFAVNNAGVTGPLNDFLNTTEEQYDFIFDINVKGVFLSMQVEIAMMIKNGFGRIVNVGSEASFSGGFMGFSAYTSSKFAVAGLTKNVAVEYANKGININAIAPGTMLTPMVEAFSQEDQDALADIRPSKRLVNVDNVATTAVYLCSDYSKDMVGSIISIDGGKTAE